MRIAALILLLMNGSVPALGQSAGEAGEAAPAERLTAVLSRMETMTADVHQLILDQDGVEVQEAEARLAVRKPDHFYWRTVSPYEEVMVTDGSRIWIHEPDLGQVTIQDFADEINRTPALLFSGQISELEASFDISMGTPGDEAELRFILLPRDPGSLFERLSLSFSGGVPVEMQFENSLGQQTSLTFSNVEVNAPVEESLFQFEIPRGVEVIDATRPANVN